MLNFDQRVNSIIFDVRGRVQWADPYSEEYRSNKYFSDTYYLQGPVHQGRLCTFLVHQGMASSALSL
jgi:hypothetical protein